MIGIRFLKIFFLIWVSTTFVSINSVRAQRLVRTYPGAESSMVIGPDSIAFDFNKPIYDLEVSVSSSQGKIEGALYNLDTPFPYFKPAAPIKAGLSYYVELSKGKSFTFQVIGEDDYRSPEAYIPDSENEKKKKGRHWTSTNVSLGSSVDFCGTNACWMLAEIILLLSYFM